MTNFLAIPVIDVNVVTQVILLDSDCIKFMGQVFYTEEYVKEMMRREHQRGKKENEIIHIAEITPINQEEQ